MATVDDRMMTLIRRGELKLSQRMTKYDYEALAVKLGCKPSYAKWIVSIYRRNYNQKVNG